MSEYELLNKEIGGVKLRDMTAITFVSLIAKKIDGISAYSADAQALSQMVKSPPMGKMSDEAKIEAVKRLEKLNITL